MHSKRLPAAMITLALVATACGNDDESSVDTAVSEETDVPQLTFDGSDCTFAGPAEVTDGFVVVELVNASDGTANIAVGKLDEGYTVDDVIELFSEEPATGGPPPWISDMGTGSPAGPGETLRWEGTLDAGEYSLGCTSRFSGWFGSGLTVVRG